MQTKIAHAINIILVFFMTVLLSFQVESPLDERRIITAYFSQVYRMQRIVSKCFPSLRASENGSSERQATLRMPPQRTGPGLKNREEVAVSDSSSCAAWILMGPRMAQYHAHCHSAAGGIP